MDAFYISFADNNFSNECMNESMQKYVRMLMIAIYQKSSNSRDSEANSTESGESI